jgi:hypothetical protein
LFDPVFYSESARISLTNQRDDDAHQQIHEYERQYELVPPHPTAGSLVPAFAVGVHGFAIEIP